MALRISTFPFIIRWLIPKGTIALTIFPFIWVESLHLLEDNVLVTHEKIHLRQQIEMGIVLFYLWYGIEFLFKCIRYKNKFWAYKNISFEREAFVFEHDENYLKRRKFWAFLQWL